MCVCCEVLEGHKGHRGAQESMVMRVVMVKQDHIAMICVRGSGSSLGVERRDML